MIIGKGRNSSDFPPIFDSATLDSQWIPFAPPHKMTLRTPPVLVHVAKHHGPWVFLGNFFFLDERKAKETKHVVRFGVCQTVHTQFTHSDIPI